MMKHWQSASPLHFLFSAEHDASRVNYSLLWAVLQVGFVSSLLFLTCLRSHPTIAVLTRAHTNIRSGSSVRSDHPLDNPLTE